MSNFSTLIFRSNTANEDKAAAGVGVRGGAQRNPINHFQDQWMILRNGEEVWYTYSLGIYSWYELDVIHCEPRQGLTPTGKGMSCYASEYFRKVPYAAKALPNVEGVLHAWLK